MAAPPAAHTSGVSRYGGIATRAVALAIDVALAHVIVFALAAMLALVGSLAGAHGLDTLEKILAGCLWALVVATYFIVFWSTAGQTPGMRTMGLQGPRRLGPAPGRGAVDGPPRRPHPGDHPARRRLPAGALRRPPPRAA